MPWVESHQFGTLEYDANAAIAFPQGLPGFELERRFVLLEPESLKPLIFLQSLASPALCFTMVPVATITADYELQLSAEDHDLLGNAGSLLASAIVCNGEVGGLTANLLAPVAINVTNRVGVQAVRWDTVYSHAQPLGEAMPCS
jgi:flagellar assembly factor FliW